MRELALLPGGQERGRDLPPVLLRGGTRRDHAELRHAGPALDHEHDRQRDDQSHGDDPRDRPGEDLAAPAQPPEAAPAAAMAAACGAAASAARRAHPWYQAGSLRLLPVRGRRRVPGLPVSLLAPWAAAARILAGRTLLAVTLLAVTLLAVASLLVALLAVSGLLLVARLARCLGPVPVRAVSRRTVRWLPGARLRRIPGPMTAVPRAAAARGLAARGPAARGPAARGFAVRNRAPTDRSRPGRGLARPARIPAQVTRWRTTPAPRATPVPRTILARRRTSPGGAAPVAGPGPGFAAGLARTAPARPYALARPAPPAGPAARRGRPMGLVSCCVSGRSSRYDRT